jgi:hypothetical protein
MPPPNTPPGMPPMPTGSTGMPPMPTGSTGMPLMPTGLTGMKGGARNTRKSSRMPMRGSKAQVWHGTAHHTTGGLTKKDLMMTKNGRIVSRKKHALGKKALRRLVKAGYKAKKGTFKLFKRSK